MADIADSREPGVRVGVPGGRGVLVGDQGEQVNQFIQTYIEHQVVQAAPPPAAEPVVAGNVPQEPPAFRPRKDLEAALRRRGSGGPLVQAVIGMPGAGKTQVAAAYARARINQGWRLVAWVEAGDTAKVLNGLAEVAAGLGIGRPGENLTSIGADVRHQLERDGKRCLVVFVPRPPRCRQDNQRAHSQGHARTHGLNGKPRPADCCAPAGRTSGAQTRPRVAEFGFPGSRSKPGNHS